MITIPLVVAAVIVLALSSALSYLVGGRRAELRSDYLIRVERGKRYHFELAFSEEVVRIAQPALSEGEIRQRAKHMVDLAAPSGANNSANASQFARSDGHR